MINTRVTARTPQAEVRTDYNPRDPWNVNVGQVERLLSVVGGSACVLTGIVRRDLSGLFVASLGSLLLYRGITGHSFLYKALDITTVEESPHSREVLPEHQGIKIRRAVTILRTPEDLYQFWRQVENAPLYMQRIASVTRTGERTSHWSAQLPGGRTVEWDSQITEEIPSRLIAWQTTDTALIEHRGRVRFEAAPGDQGTVVTLEVELPLAGGILSRALGDLPGKLPEQLIREDLRRFKELMEAGEVPTIKGQPQGKIRR